MLVSLNTFNRFVTLLEIWRCIVALELNHLNRSPDLA